MTDSNIAPTIAAAGSPQVAAAGEAASHRPVARIAGRSALVTGSGAVLALSLWVLFAGISMLVGKSPVAFLINLFRAVGDFGFATYVLAVLVLGIAVGLATMRHWAGWRFYAGIFGWLCLVLCYWVVTFFLRGMAEDRPPSNGFIAIAAALALAGIGLLVAKRGEPSAKPFGLMTLLGLAMAVVGIPALAYAVLMHGIFFVAIYPPYALSALISGTAAGLAVMRRWPGWRFYAGIFGWLYIVLSVVVMTLFFEGVAHSVTGKPPSNGFIVVAAALALLGMGLLIAKRVEPPATPFGLVTPIGVGMAVLSIPVFVVSAVMHHIVVLAIELAIVGVVLAFGGVALAFRWRGWRIAAECLGWLLIVGGVAGWLWQASLPHDAKAFFGLWISLRIPVLCVAFGYLMLWAKRREPKPQVVRNVTPGT